MKEQVTDPDLSLDGEIGKCYLNETITDKAAMKNPAHNVRFTDEQIAEADRLEIWSSSYTPDNTPDFNWFRLMKGEGRVIAQHRQDGF